MSTTPKLNIAGVTVIPVDTNVAVICCDDVEPATAHVAPAQLALDQPPSTEPAAGIAVSWTVPGNGAVHADPQWIPTGDDTTVPVPEPASTTLNSRVPVPASDVAYACPWLVTVSAPVAEPRLLGAYATETVHAEPAARADPHVVDASERSLPLTWIESIVAVVAAVFVTAIPVVAAEPTSM
jgi:hypothetical protein